MDTGRYSIERLILLAYEQRLITDYRMDAGSVTLERKGHRIELDPEEARLFLWGLTSGYLEAHAVEERPLRHPRKALRKLPY